MEVWRWSSSNVFYDDDDDDDDDGGGGGDGDGDGDGDDDDDDDDAVPSSCCWLSCNAPGHPHIVAKREEEDKKPPVHENGRGWDRRSREAAARQWLQEEERGDGWMDGWMYGWMDR